MNKYCSNPNCRKRIPIGKHSNYCSMVCKIEDKKSKTKKEWISISIKTQVKNKLIDIQNNIKNKKLGLSDIIDSLINIVTKEHNNVHKRVEKEFFE